VSQKKFIMTKASLYFLSILIFASCVNSSDSTAQNVETGIEVKYNDPLLRPLFAAIQKVNRDSMGFAPLDSNSKIIYKEEYNGTLIKLFFERPDYLTILYFGKSNNVVVYQSEDETTKGPRKMFVKDVDGYKTEIQETIERSFETNKENNFGKKLYITFLDLDKYPDKRPYNQDSSEHHPQSIYETEISLEQSKEVIARWNEGK
jgi:hypothetical protein